ADRIGGLVTPASASFAAACFLSAFVAAPLIATAAESTVLKDVKEFQSRKQTSDPETWPGAPIYRATCSSCHEGQVPKAPPKMFLQMMTPAGILRALDQGLMKQQASALSEDDRRHVAEYLASTSLDAASKAPAAPRCSGRAAMFDDSVPALGNGWGHDNSRFIP